MERASESVKGLLAEIREAVKLSHWITVITDPSASMSRKLEKLLPLINKFLL